MLKRNLKEKFKSHGDGKFRCLKFASIGKNVIFEKGVLVFHPENIKIDSNVYIGHNTILKGYYSHKMTVGTGTWIGQQCFLHSAGGLAIGKNVGIGPGVIIITSSHRADNLDKPILRSPIKFQKVSIEDDADIGVGSIILPGVTIGRGSMIGAGSTVTKDVPPYSVAAGNPAKVIKFRK